MQIRKPAAENPESDYCPSYSKKLEFVSSKRTRCSVVRAPLEASSSAQSSLKISMQRFSVVGTRLREILYIEVQVFLIKALQNFPFHHHIQKPGVHHHACGGIDRPGNRDFQNVIVTMPIGIVTLAVDAVVLFLAQ